MLNVRACIKPTLWQQLVALMVAVIIALFVAVVDQDNASDQTSQRDSTTTVSAATLH